MTQGRPSYAISRGTPGPCLRFAPARAIPGPFQEGARTVTIDLARHHGLRPANAEASGLLRVGTSVR